MDGQQAEFDGKEWKGVCPKVAVNDQIFVNENIFSGDTVSHDHLKRQYGLVVGERGVSLMRESIALNEELKEVNATLKRHDRAIQSAMTSLDLRRMTVDQFVALENDDRIDTLIANKEQEVQRATRTDEIKRTSLPEFLPLPSEAQQFREVLTSSVDGVAADAYDRMRAHIDGHRKIVDVQSVMSHESWLEAGLAFEPDDPYNSGGASADLHCTPPRRTGPS